MASWSAPREKADPAPTGVRDGVGQVWIAWTLERSNKEDLSSVAWASGSYTVPRISPSEVATLDPVEPPEWTSEAVIPEGM